MGEPSDRSTAMHGVKVLASSGDLDAALNHRVAVEGTAERGKAGPLVVRDDMVLHVIGLDDWPDDVAGSLVYVVGTLVRRKAIPDPVGPNGEIRQGAWGDQYLMENVTWDLVRTVGAVAESPGSR